MTVIDDDSEIVKMRRDSIELIVSLPVVENELLLMMTAFKVISANNVSPPRQ